MSNIHVQLVGVLLVVAAACVSAAVEKSGLELLCRGSSSIELVHVSDVFPFIEAAKLDASSCSEGARQSILDLEPIVRSENVCSVGVARQIVRYYERFVSRKGQYFWKLPKQVRRYFMAVAFLVHYQCERNLETQLKPTSEARITEEDNRVMKEFNSRANQLAEIVMSLEPRLQSLFIVTSPDDATASAKTISVNPKSKLIFDEIKLKCRNKFKPIYDKFILPLVVLENVGFSYDIDYMGEWEEFFRSKETYRDWFKVVFICESALRQRVIVAPQTSVDSEGHEQQVSVLSEKELADLKRETGLSFDDQDASADEKPEEFELSIKLDDKVQLTSFAMDELISKFAAKHKQAKEARPKLLKRFMEEAQYLIENGHVRPAYDNKDNAPKKRNWFAKAMNQVASAFGVAIAYPLEMAILVPGWITLVVVLEFVQTLPS